MFRLIKVIEIFMGSLVSIVNAYNHKKCVSLSNLKCMTTVINLHPNEYCQKFHYSQIAVRMYWKL